MKAGNTYIWLMNGLTYKTGSGLLRSSPDWRPTHLGDFDGDGKSDLVWYNDGNGQTTRVMMDGTTPTSTVIVASGGTRVALVGDFNGNGKSDILWRNRATAKPRCG